MLRWITLNISILGDLYHTGDFSIVCTQMSMCHSDILCLYGWSESYTPLYHCRALGICATLRKRKNPLSLVHSNVVKCITSRREACEIGTVTTPQLSFEVSRFEFALPITFLDSRSPNYI